MLKANKLVALLSSLKCLAAAAFVPGSAMAEPVTFPGGRASNLGAYPMADRVRGTLLFPNSAPTNERLPAVVLLHGSGGVDGRGAYHGEALRAAGFATLELDMFPANGRPSGGNRVTMSHAYGALKFLASHPRIDPRRIGAMGFSWGANMAIRLAAAEVREMFRADIGDVDFRALVAFYPVCYLHLQIAESGQANGFPLYRQFNGTPTWIAIGQLDDYGDISSCRRFVDTVSSRPGARFTLTVYPNATHGWDSPPHLSRVIYDPVAHDGRGGQVRFWPNPTLASTSRDQAVTFFRQHLPSPAPVTQSRHRERVRN